MAVKSVLLIEDNLPLATGLQACLESRGYQVVHALDGQDGLDICRERIPDLVVTDVLMKTMDGLSFLQHLRSLPGGWDVPVIVISGVTQQEIFDEMWALGVQRFVIKPFSLEDFLNIVREAIGERHPKK
jgi:CheY-like chemotaxis protein